MAPLDVMHISFQVGVAGVLGAVSHTARWRESVEGDRGTGRGAGAGRG